MEDPAVRNDEAVVDGKGAQTILEAIANLNLGHSGPVEPHSRQGNGRGSAGRQRHRIAQMIPHLGFEDVETGVDEPPALLGTSSGPTRGTRPQIDGIGRRRRWRRNKTGRRRHGLTRDRGAKLRWSLGEGDRWTAGSRHLPGLCLRLHTRIVRHRRRYRVVPKPYRRKSLRDLRDWRNLRDHRLHRHRRCRGTGTGVGGSEVCALPGLACRASTPIPRSNPTQGSHRLTLLRLPGQGGRSSAALAITRADLVKPGQRVCNRQVLKMDNALQIHV